MSDLVRRLLENTSNEGFLKAKFSDNAGPEQLLRDPRSLVTKTPRPTSATPAAARNGKSLETPPGDTYENSPLVNFVHEKARNRMRSAIEEMRPKLGRKYAVVIDGKKIWTDNYINSINPSSPTQVVGAVELM